LTKFADRLYEDLMREHGATLRSLSEQGAQSPARAVPQPTPKRRRRAARPAWLTAGIATATGAVAGGFVLFGAGAAPAYAVTQNANGTVSIAVHQASAIDAANSKLKVLGARVVVVPVHAGCPSVGSLENRDTNHSGAISIGWGTDGSITVGASAVPENETLVVGFDTSHGGLFQAGSILVKGKVPSCISLPTPADLPPAPAGGAAGNQSGAADQGTTDKH